jgi:hypothetical protein
MKPAAAILLILLTILAGLPAEALAQTVFTTSSGEARAMVRAITSHAPDIAGAEQGDFYDRNDDVRVTAGEVFVGARKLGVVQRVPRQQIQSVVPARKSHHVGRWIAIGAAAFGAVMLVWFIHYANCGCG